MMGPTQATVGGKVSVLGQGIGDRGGRQVGDRVAALKMKVGRDADVDPHRLDIAREAIGADVELFVDANGRYTRKQALALAAEFADRDVRWFEEPVSSDDRAGLRLIRDRAPFGMDVTAGEYGYVLPYFRDMLAPARSTASGPTPLRRHHCLPARWSPR